jgi:regulatory protein
MREPKRLDAEALWQYALRVLAGRAHSSGELRQKLRNRAAKASDVDGVLARLKDHGYLDDKKFAEGFAAARLENQQLGKTRVIQELRQRRVAPAVAERTVQKIYQNVNEEELIEEVIRRKFRRAPRENLFQDQKELASAYRKLLRAGFRSASALKVLKRFARDPDLLDGFEPPAEHEEE